MTYWTDTTPSTPALLAALKSFLRRRAGQRQHKRAMTSLVDADERTLRDLGITREEVNRAIGSARPQMPNADLIFLKGPRPKR